jgi:hypothetical protein
MSNRFLGIIVIGIFFATGCAGVGGIKNTAYTHNPQLSATNLRDLPSDFEKNLKGKINAEELYVFVHPSYFIFFHRNKLGLAKKASGNLVQTFINMKFLDERPKLRLMKEYERTEMEFLSSAARDGKLVLLVLPGGYLNSKQYVYRNGTDEYTRYLNDVTQRSDTVFYIETISSTSGKLDEYDEQLLVRFLKKAGVKKIYIGGGYVGRCQKEFYKFVSRVWPMDDVAIVPEISSFSPHDVSDSTAKMLLTSDMKLNILAAQYYIKNSVLRELDVNLKPLSEVPAALK